MPGAQIVVAAWITNVLFGVTAIPFAAGVDAFEVPAIAMALLLFALSLVVWPWALARAFVRSSEGDDLAVASLFFTVGDAPRQVKWHLFAALGVNVAIAAAAAVANPFGTLVPMLSFGFVGLWAAVHGSFPRRPDAGSDRS
jgi:hypothetical protein